MKELYQYSEMCKKIDTTIKTLEEVGFIFDHERKEILTTPLEKKIHEELQYLKSKGYKLKGG